MRGGRDRGVEAGGARVKVEVEVEALETGGARAEVDAIEVAAAGGLIAVDSRGVVLLGAIVFEVGVASLSREVEGAIREPVAATLDFARADRTDDDVLVRLATGDALVAGSAASSSFFSPTEKTSSSFPSAKALNSFCSFAPLLPGDLALILIEAYNSDSSPFSSKIFETSDDMDNDLIPVEDESACPCVRPWPCPPGSPIPRPSEYPG